MTLAFDSARHVYELDGTRVLSVTQCLRLSGVIDDGWYTEFGRQRGQYVHQLLEFEDTGELDEATLDDRLRPYLDAYRRFRADSGVEEWTAIEQRLGDPLKRYAGTLDRLGEFGLVDFKSGQPEPWIALQLALYAQLAEVNGLVTSARKTKRWGLFLKSDGSYKLQSYSDREDFGAADAARVVAQWRWAKDRRRCLYEDSEEESIYATA